MAATDGGILEAGDDGGVLDDDTDNRPRPTAGRGARNADRSLPCWACYREEFEPAAAPRGRFVSTDDPEATDLLDADPGTPATMASVETLAQPTTEARLTLGTVATADGRLVDIGLRSDQTRGRGALSRGGPHGRRPARVGHRRGRITLSGATSFGATHTGFPHSGLLDGAVLEKVSLTSTAVARYSSKFSKQHYGFNRAGTIYIEPIEKTNKNRSRQSIFNRARQGWSARQQRDGIWDVVRDIGNSNHLPSTDCACQTIQ